MTESKESSYVYSDKVLDHFLHPRNVGIMAHASTIGNAGNSKCGDVVRLYLKIERNTIVDVKVKVFGCPVAIAATSLLSEMIKNKTLQEASKIKNEDISAAFGGLPPHKLDCSVLAEAVLSDAISRYERSGSSSIPSTRSSGLSTDVAQGL